MARRKISTRIVTKSSNYYARRSFTDTEKLSRRAWYAEGGLSNPNLYRIARKNGTWQYFKKHR